MPDLVACGQKRTQQWRQALRDGEVVRLGRAPRDTSSWAVPWDYLISREHADLHWTGEQLVVRCLDSAKNPIYFHDRPAAEFAITIGEEFRIGTTLFKLDFSEGDEPAYDESSLEERSYSAMELRSALFGNASDRLEVLARLPALISRSRSDEDFAAQLTDLLLAAIPRAEATAVIDCRAEEQEEKISQTMLRWNSRRGDISGFRPSQRLIAASVRQQNSIVHVWNDIDGAEQAYTVSGRFEWAFATPIPGRTGRTMCLYVSGRCSPVVGSGTLSGIFTADDLKGDVRFSQLLAHFIGAIRKVRRLEHLQVSLAQFFSPAVMESLVSSGGDALAPREAEISALFCDLRGFSRATERSRQDLRGLLTRVSDALGVMTRSILRYDGVVADFQGDAALGFWGWPIPAADSPLLAARAALTIQNEFRRANEQPGSALFDFRVGIGIAHGRAIAGRMGTDEQAKVGAFGPVVTLGGRLEGLTKKLRASILLDEVTADFLKQYLPASEGRVRRLGRIRRQGGDEVFTVGELLPPAGPGSPLTDEHIAEFEAAVEAVAAGRWSKALQHLERLPATDRVKDFLMISIALNDYRPPAGWDGVIELPGR